MGIDDVTAGDVRENWATATGVAHEAEEAEQQAEQQAVPDSDHSDRNSSEPEILAEFGPSEWFHKRSDRPVSASTATLSDAENDMIIDDLESLDGTAAPFILQPDL